MVNLPHKDIGKAVYAQFKSAQQFEVNVLTNWNWRSNFGPIWSTAIEGYTEYRESGLCFLVSGVEGQTLLSAASWYWSCQ